MEIDRQAIYRDWLRNALKITNKRPTPFATEAGLSASTVARAIDEGKPTEIKERTIDKLASFWGIEPPVVAPMKLNGRIGGFSEPEIVPYRYEAMEDMTTDPSRSNWEVQNRTLELAGYLPGDVVTVDSAVPPRAGDIVRVRIIDLHRGTAEDALRHYDPPYIVSKTADPHSQTKPLIVDNERVTILGTVVRLVRGRRA